MNLSQHFRIIASGREVRIQTLEMNRPYSVLYARRLSKKYGPTVLIALQAEENMNVKIYLAKSYADGLNVDDIEDINTRREKYKLI